ncbi:DUF4363 family protein [Petroclostridium sp. X23]|uniref:DUF4363 family protein n=1 Tax=Petroclostridium sp. X23 TaxID=3045146 RepID=UPI0024AE64A9|nr:DUF4363 family protein [Petroclostridium sp. X23]WHH58912.1 DUF4363 family protein [Petroclostridium sp. X23]
MKTFKFSMILLVLIILSTIWYIHSLNNVSNQLVTEIDKLEDIIKTDNWDQAEKQLDHIQEEWDKTEKWMATLIDHEEIDSIRLTLARLSQYIHYRKTPDFMAESASLKLLIKHLPEKERISLGNLL